MKFYEWTTEKPEFNESCVVICATMIRNNWEYTVYIVEKVYGGDGWYWGWLTGDGEEYGDLADMGADMYYLFPPLANTMFEKPGGLKAT